MSKQQASQRKPLRGVKWIAGPFALAGVLGWIVIGHGPAPASALKPVALHEEPAPAHDGYAASALGPAPKQDLSKAAQASAVREVERIARERNRAGEQDRKAFQADGWEIVKTDAPEPRLLALDPALLTDREDDLRVQLASTVAAPQQAPNLSEIARRGSKPETRTAAVEALGRIGGRESQRELLGLLTNAGLEAEDPARRAITPLLRPANLREPFASELARLLDSSKLTAVERKQLAFTLALVGLRDGTELPAETLQALSSSSRDLLQSMVALATQSNPISP
jgi:hypothetical protein